MGFITFGTIARSQTLTFMSSAIASPESVSGLENENRAEYKQSTLIGEASATINVTPIRNRIEV